MTPHYYALNIDTGMIGEDLTYHRTQEHALEAVTDFLKRVTDLTPDEIGEATGDLLAFGEVERQGWKFELCPVE